MVYGANKSHSEWRLAQQYIFRLDSSFRSIMRVIFSKTTVDVYDQQMTSTPAMNTTTLIRTTGSYPAHLQTFIIPFWSRAKTLKKMSADLLAKYELEIARQITYDTLVMTSTTSHAYSMSINQLHQQNEAWNTITKASVGPSAIGQS